MKQTSRCVQGFFLFLVGGFAYGGLELLYKGGSHISMFIAGGLSFFLIGKLNEGTRNPSLLLQMLLSSMIITVIEFICGVIVNLGLHLNVWDYSHLRWNLLGQICVPFSLLWFVLSFFAILADDYIRYFLFGEKKPKYHIF